MRNKFLFSLFMLSLAGAGVVGCDDDEPLATRDASVTDTAATDTAKPDAGVTTDTGTPTPDVAADTAKPDAAADMATTPDAVVVDVAAEVKADTTTSPDTTVPQLDGAVDTAPDAAAVDTAPDTVVVADVAPDVTTPTDLAPMLINGCTSFEDGTVSPSDRYINWGVGNGVPAMFATQDERCLTVKVGQMVTFGGDFLNHPFAAAGGDSPAIPDRLTGTVQEDYVVTFSTVGTFGYKCNTHPVMTGAIHVIP
jgi:hypothetical protein